MAGLCGRLATQPGEREVGSEDRERLGHRTCKTRHFKGFDTERARLGTFRGFGTERARLAQGGFLGQFSKRNPLKRNF